MGANTMWVCITCKTVCSRGGKPIYFAAGFDMTKEGIANLNRSLHTLCTVIELDGCEHATGFLDDLTTWLGRHEGHYIHIGSGYSTDMMDLDDYHNETVDGQVSRFSRLEVDLAYYNEWQESSILDIQKVIEEYADNKDDMSSRKIAEELFIRYGLSV